MHEKLFDEPGSGSSDVIRIGPTVSALVFREGAHGIEVHIHEPEDNSGEPPMHVKMCAMIAGYIAKNQDVMIKWFKEDFEEFQNRVDKS